MKTIIILGLLTVSSIPSISFAQTPVTKQVPPEITDKEQPKTIIIDPDPKKCIPEPCITITKPARPSSETFIEESGIKVKANFPLKVEDNKIKLDDKDQKQVILPSEVEKKLKIYSLQKGILPTKISKMSLSKCLPKEGPQPPCEENTPVYNVDVEKEPKLLGVIPIKTKINYQLEATNGRVITETKPWFLRIVPFLFKF